MAQPYQATVTAPLAAEHASSSLRGHPRGLMTLFFVEMWERFSYYGMRALLVLFMTESLTVANHGMGLDIKTASAIYGLYTAGVYLFALPGGWVADKLWGQRRAVFVGGCIIASGHFSMAIPTQFTFFLGLGLIVIGTGLLKPNASVMVADLYPEGGARRDAGFSIFYMGINVGGFLGPALCGIIGEDYNFHWGFALAGFGMILGLAQYAMGGKHLGAAGQLENPEPPAHRARRARNFYLIAGGFAAAVAAFVYLVSSGAIAITIQQVAERLAYVIVLVAAVFFTYLFMGAGLTALEKRRMVVIVWLFLLSAVFWSGFEQAGLSMNIFARDLTNRQIGGLLMPASWLQNVNPIFIIIFAPVFAWVWTWLAARKAHPSIPVKFALGLLGLGAGFLVLSWGAANATTANRASMAWLVTTYFLFTVGELCLSPVGLSSMTKLAPKDRTGEMMGLWFVSVSLGDLLAGLVAGHMEELTPAMLFRDVAWIAAAAGIIALLVSPLVKPLTSGVD